MSINGFINCLSRTGLYLPLQFPFFASQRLCEQLLQTNTNEERNILLWSRIQCKVGYKDKKTNSKNGYEGYGLYWELIEDLYQNANALPLDYDCITYDLRTSSDMIRSIVNDFDLFEG